MNSIYRVIWNSALNQWTVVSELAKGKTKSSTSKSKGRHLTSKVVAGMALVASLTAPAFASSCDVGTLTCTLDATWTATDNNAGAGSVTIDDGSTYGVVGPTGFTNGESSRIVYTSINKLITDGFIIGEDPVSTTDKRLILGAKNQTILVRDPILGSNISVVVYKGSQMHDGFSEAIPNGMNVMKGGPLNVYSKTRFVTVENGVANVDFSATPTLEANLRNSQLVYADGTKGTKAEANWVSNNVFHLYPELDWLAAPTQKVAVTKNSFNGKFTAYDGVTVQEINSLADFKVYNDWLVAELQANKLTYANYEAELNRAFTQTEKYYVVNKIPTDADTSISGEPLGRSAILHGNGKDATVRVASTGRIAAVLTIGTDNVFYLENGATGINDGEITNRQVMAYTSGSTFINNNKLILGMDGGVFGSGVISDASSKFINNGIINLNPVYYYLNAASNYEAYAVSLHAGSIGENNSIMNVGITEGNKGRTISGMVRGAKVIGNKASFVNNTLGKINVGYSEAGEDVYTRGGSAGIYAEGVDSIVNNKGTITLSKKTDGSYAILASKTTGTSAIENSGTITINSNGDDGQFTVGANTGIYASGASKNVINSGTININGTNSIGLKAIEGSEITSTATGKIIIAGGIDPLTKLRNYGAWSEGTGSIIKIAGEVNLNGDGAIGVHARGKGSIELSDYGRVTFAGGENQIGYFIHGTGSTLNNLGKGIQDITTKNSTLMRLEAGAAFTGSAGATSTMSASGENSKVIVASGEGTTVNSGGMTVNVSGLNATGFVIEGGATGIISASANINLSNTGAVAGIADGKGTNLAGEQSTSITVGTTLTSAADLNSTLDNVTGYIARNEAALTNMGNIDFSGENTTGLSIEEGSTGTNSGNITIGLGGQGLVASSIDKDTKLTNTGSLTLNGDFTSDADRTIGVSASGNKVTVDVNKGSGTGPVITLGGKGAVGVKAEAGSLVTLDDSVQMKFNDQKSDQIGFWASGTGSTISTEAGATAIDVHGNGATLFFVDEGASLAGKMNVDLVGSNKEAINSALRVSGDGSVASIATGSTITIGNNSTGVYAENKGSATIDSGVTVNLNGANATAGQAIGVGSKVTNAAEIKSNATSDGAIAFYAEDGGEIINTGAVDLSLGKNNIAIKAVNGNVTNSSNINVTGTGIDISGANSVINNTGTIVAVDGTASIRVSGGAELALSGGGTVTAKGTADAILLDTGTKSFVVSGATINVNASGSTGIGINNKAGIAGIKLTNTTINVANGVGISSNKSLDITNSGTINIAGSGTGIKLDNAGAALAENIDLSGSSGLTINANAAGGQGIVANIGSSNTFNSTATINVNDVAGGSAILLTGGDSFTQGGVITSKSGDVIDAQNVKAITNTGTITAGDNTKVAIVMGEQAITFVNSGSIKGTLDFKGNNNTATLNKSSIVDGTMSFGAGDNVVTVDNATAGNVTAGNGKLAIEVKGASKFGNLAAGTGVTDSLTFTGSKYTTTSGQTITGFETLALQSASTFTTDTLTTLPTTGDKLITIDADSTLALNKLTVGSTLINKVTGSGTIAVNSGNQSAFNLGAEVKGFTGTVALTDTRYALAGTNTQALTNATLKVSSDSLVTVAKGTEKQTIGGLTFDGGTVAIDTAVNIPGGEAELITNHINVTGVLNLNGGGTIQLDSVDLAAPIDVKNATVNLSILDQQIIGSDLIHVGLMKAGDIAGNAGSITLIDKSDNVISSSQKTVMNLEQGTSGLTKAKGTYDIRAGNTATELYVGYGLSQLELMTSGADAFNLSTAGATNKTFDAKITGTGDLAVNAGAETLTIENVNNEYAGKTLVQTGTLKLGTSSALGKTSELNLAASTKVDLNEKTQTIGALNTVSGSTLDINKGTLTVTNGGAVSGVLTGTSGALNVTSGTLTVNSENAALAIDTTISNAAILDLNKIAGIGTSSITVQDSASTLNVNDNGVLANTLKGAGQVVATSGQQIELTADNKDFLGTYAIADTSTLKVTTENNIGGANAIANEGTLNIDNTSAFNLVTIVSGTGELVKDSAGILTITGTNTYAGNTVVNKGVVAVSANANLGADNNTVILSGGKLQLTGSDTFNHALELTKEGAVIVDSGKTATLSKGWAGAGNTLVKEGAGTLVLEGDNSANAGAFNIDLGTLQVEAMTNVGDALGNINIANNGTLSIIKTIAADETIERTLLGSGLVAVDLGAAANKLTLGANNTGVFTGQVSMNQGTFDVNASNSTALANGVLALHQDSIGNLTTGNHTIGGLIIDGTHLNVATKSGAIDTLVNVKTLAVTSNGGSVTLEGGLPIGSDITLPMGASDLSFFDQFQLKEQIVSADNVTGAGTQLDLLDNNDQLVGSSADSKLIAADGTDLGTAFYGDIALTVSDVTSKSGIFLAYGLKQLDANAGQTITISNTAGRATELGTLLTGNGGFTIDAVGDVRIGNALNSYEGTTAVNSGTVHLLSNSALGKTSELAIKDQAGVNLEGMNQTVGMLNTEVGSTLDFNGGNLTVTNGGLTSGTLTGTSGTLVTQGNAPLTITGDNSGLKIDASINTNSAIVLQHAKALGASAIKNEGTLTLDQVNGTFANNLSGQAGTLQLASSDVTLGGYNGLFYGAIAIDQNSHLTATSEDQLGLASVDNSGQMTLDVDKVLMWNLTTPIAGTGDLIKTGEGILTVDSAQTYIGKTTIENGLMIVQSSHTGTGAVSLASSSIEIKQGGALGGYGSVAGDVYNAGALGVGSAINGTDDFGAFTIGGNYIGQGGTVILGTVLADDASQSDRLVIQGDASGQSYVVINNVRGSGAQTSNGIEVVDIAGNSSAQFDLVGRAVAGAYEYSLNRGTDGNWYLQSEKIDDGNGTGTLSYRPEAGGYLANIAAVNSLFTHQLTDRMQQSVGKDGRSAWVRIVGNHGKFKDSSGRLSTTTNNQVVQVGGDIVAQQLANNGLIKFGALFGYGHTKSKTRGLNANTRATSTGDGYALGLYGTWFQNSADLTGAYVDTWIQYVHFENKVKGSYLQNESYDAKGVIASIEAGYTFKIRPNFFIAPQAQVTWMNVKADDHRESNGTHVRSGGQGNVQTRVGARAFGEFDLSNGGKLRPYAELNWLHNTKSYYVDMDGTRINQQGAKNIGQIKAGINAQFNDQLSIWGDLSHDIGKHSYRNTKVSLGLKYTF